MKKPVVTFYMRAYNAEKYIEQSIRSILDQTIGELEFILVNNASTDNTGKICKYYADRDSRIIYRENEENISGYQGKRIPIMGEYIAFLDADDYLEKDFIRMMVEAGGENGADMIICGTEMFIDGNPERKGLRIPPAFVTENPPDIANNFRGFYGSLRPLWGKLFRTELYLECEQFIFDKPAWLTSGADTFAVLRFLRKCRSFVSVDKVLHHYRVHETSIYHSRVAFDRLLETHCLFEEALGLLRDWGQVTKEQIDFLHLVHWNSIKDCLGNVVRNTSASLADRLNLVQEITRDAFFCGYALNDTNSEITFAMIENTLRDILSELSEADKALAGQFYLVRLHRALDETESNGKAGNTALLLSALSDPENLQLWGINSINGFARYMPHAVKGMIALLSEHMPFILKHPMLMRELVNGDTERAVAFMAGKETTLSGLRERIETLAIFNTPIDKGIVDQLKEKISAYLSAGNVEEAIPLLSSVMENRILDREGLYFKIYIAWQTGDKALALDTAEIAGVFWRDDPDMMAMCGDVFAAAGAFSEAEAFYHAAIEASDDNAFNEEISGRMKEYAS